MIKFLSLLLFIQCQILYTGNGNEGLAVSCTRMFLFLTLAIEPCGIIDLKCDRIHDNGEPNSGNSVKHRMLL